MLETSIIDGDSAGPFAAPPSHASRERESQHKNILGLESSVSGESDLSASSHAPPPSLEVGNDTGDTVRVTSPAEDAPASPPQVDRSFSPSKGARDLPHLQLPSLPTRTLPSGPKARPSVARCLDWNEKFQVWYFAILPCDLDCCAAGHLGWDLLSP